MSGTPQQSPVITSMDNAPSHEVTLGKNFVYDRFEADTDTPPEDLYEDELLHDLAHDRFVKIDDNIEMMVDKEANEIIFRKNGPATDKCVGEYVMRLEPGELEKVMMNMLAIKEGIFTAVSLKSNNIELRLTKNCKEQFVAAVMANGSVAISMISTTSALFRKMIYILLYGILK